MLGRIEGRHVDVDEANIRVLEGSLRGRGEVAVAGADTDHQIGLAGEPISGGCTGGADGSQAERVVVAQTTATSERLTDWNSCLLRESAQRFGRLAVHHATAGHDQRPLAGSDRLRGASNRRAIGPIARDPPYAPGEQRLGVVVRLRLHVLRQTNRHRAGLGRVGQDAHGRGQCTQQLVGAVDAVPVAADRFEAVVHRDVLGVLGLQLLQDRRDVAPGEDVTRQQQHRQAIDRRGRGTREHVGRAGSNGRGAGERLQTVLHLGVADGDMDLRLFVARLVVAELRHLLECLADAGHIAVTEDAETTGKERLLRAIALHVLILQKSDDRLGHGQTPGRLAHGDVLFLRNRRVGRQTSSPRHRSA